MFKHFIASFQLPTPHIICSKRNIHTQQWSTNRQDESSQQSLVVPEHGLYLEVAYTSTTIQLSNALKPLSTKLEYTLAYKASQKCINLAIYGSDQIKTA